MLDLLNSKPFGLLVQPLTGSILLIKKKKVTFPITNNISSSVEPAFASNFVNHVSYRTQHCLATPSIKKRKQTCKKLPVVGII